MIKEENIPLQASYQHLGMSAIVILGSSDRSSTWLEYKPTRVCMQLQHNKSLAKIVIPNEAVVLKASEQKLTHNVL